MCVRLLARARVCVCVCLYERNGIIKKPVKITFKTIINFGVAFTFLRFSLRFNPVGGGGRLEGTAYISIYWVCAAGKGQFLQAMSLNQEYGIPTNFLNHGTSFSYLLDIFTFVCLLFVTNWLSLQETYTCI